MTKERLLQAMESDVTGTTGIIGHMKRADIKRVLQTNLTGLKQ